MISGNGKSGQDWQAAVFATLLRIWATALLLPGLFGRALVKLYRYTLSPLVGFHCRHLPTCSDYADQAIERYGLWAGGWMTLARLLRCHPFGTSGLDFVPDELPNRARWYLPWRYGKWAWRLKESEADPA